MLELIETEDMQNLNFELQGQEYSPHQCFAAGEFIATYIGLPPPIHGLPSPMHAPPNPSLYYCV